MYTQQLLRRGGGMSSFCQFCGGKAAAYRNEQLASAPRETANLRRTGYIEYRGLAPDAVTKLAAPPCEGGTGWSERVRIIIRSLNLTRTLSPAEPELAPALTSTSEFSYSRLHAQRCTHATNFEHTKFHFRYDFPEI